MSIRRLPKTVAVVLVGFGFVITGCSNNHVDAKSGQSELTPEIVEEVGYENFDASLKPDVEKIKANTCSKEYESYKTYVGASTDEEVQESLTGPEDIKPRNFVILDVTDVSSHDGVGRATVRSTVENPEAAEGEYHQKETTDHISFTFEDGRWKFCGSPD